MAVYRIERSTGTIAAIIHAPDAPTALTRYAQSQRAELTIDTRGLKLRDAEGETYTAKKQGS